MVVMARFDYIKKEQIKMLTQLGDMAEVKRLGS